MKGNKSLFIVHLALFATAALHGSHYSAAQVAMKEIGPFPIISIRIGLSALLFWLIAIPIKAPSLSKNEIGRLILCGVMGASANVLFFYKGLEITTANNAALIMTTTPLIIFIVALLLKTETANPWKTVGVILGFVGVLSLKWNAILNFTGDAILGDLFIFINATFFGIYLVIAKPLMVKYSPIYLCKWIFTIGATLTVGVSLIIAPEQFSSINTANWSFNFWALLVYMAVGLTLLPFSLNAWALKHAPSSLVGIYLNFQPITAGILTYFIVGQTPSRENLIAAPFIIAGVFLVSKR